MFYKKLINMKRDYTLLIAVITLMVCAIIRIYFPENFQPETVSFFENYWVLTLGLCFVIGLISICVLGLWWIGNKLVKDIKSLFINTKLKTLKTNKVKFRIETLDENNNVISSSTISENKTNYINLTKQ